MKNFLVTGWMTNGIGETVSITVYNKRSRDIFFVGLEQAEELMQILEHHLTQQSSGQETPVIANWDKEDELLETEGLYER